MAGSKCLHAYVHSFVVNPSSPRLQNSLWVESFRRWDDDNELIPPVGQCIRGKAVTEVC